MNLLAFILACYGMTMVLVYSKIFEKIRPKHHFFHCTMCVGFWVGIFVNTLMLLLDMDFFNDFIIGSFLSGCISSGTSYLISRMADDDGLTIKVKKNE